MAVVEAMAGVAAVEVGMVGVVEAMVVAAVVATEAAEAVAPSLMVANTPGIMPKRPREETRMLSRLLSMMMVAGPAQGSPRGVMMT